MDQRINEILGYMPEHLCCMLSKTFLTVGDTLQEIRLRSGRPLIVETSNGSFAVLPSGNVSPAVGGAYITKHSDLKRIFRAICENSVYAFSEDIRQGFITIKGGHRVGITGKSVCENERMEGFREVSSLNIRVAREFIGAANDLVGMVLSPFGIKNTLIVAPPMGGKTTILRDLTRQLSDKGIKTALADDRGEIAALYRGVPQNDVGLQTDVLENSSKADSVTMLLRCMSPQLVVTDEISTAKDVDAILGCFGTGVSVIASAHGRDAEEVKSRPLFNKLFEKGGFRQIIVLSKDGLGPNTRILGKAFEIC